MHHKHWVQSPFQLLPMIPVHYGVFSHTYSLNMWWTHFLRIPLLSSSVFFTMVPFFYFSFWFALLCPEEKPPDLILGSLWAVLACLFPYPSFHGCLLLLCFFIKGYFFLGHLFQTASPTYLCPHLLGYLRSFGMTSLSLLYNGLFYTSLLRLCPLPWTSPKPISHKPNLPILFPMGTED